MSSEAEVEELLRKIAMFGGVTVQSSWPSDEAVVAVLRVGAEPVVAACIGVDLTWTTSAIVAPDDLSS